MDAHHYLGFKQFAGRGLRYVAKWNGEWLALLGWCAGAFKVKARDAWIGWAPEQRFRRLRLVANDCRFLVLPGGRAPNLASRALALSVRRRSGCGFYGHRKSIPGGFGLGFLPRTPAKPTP